MGLLSGTSTFAPALFAVATQRLAPATVWKHPPLARKHAFYSAHWTLVLAFFWLFFLPSATAPGSLQALSAGQRSFSADALPFMSGAQRLRIFCCVFCLQSRISLGAKKKTGNGSLPTMRERTFRRQPYCPSFSLRLLSHNARFMLSVSRTLLSRGVASFAHLLVF